MPKTTIYGVKVRFQNLGTVKYRKSKGRPQLPTTEKKIKAGKKTFTRDVTLFMRSAAEKIKTSKTFLRDLKAQNLGFQICICRTIYAHVKDFQPVQKMRATKWWRK